MGGFAWVTLATNDSYSLGALVLGHSLRRAGSPHDLVVLVTPGVSAAMRNQLSSIFTLVQEVNVLDSHDEANLALLERPELGITFTKLHCWRLTQYDKCVFLDADTLVLKNSDELFERDELSAAPDPGWPDCFNSGVFVYRPSLDTFNDLIKFALSKGSFDGGDQGLLNLFFSDWATKDISRHLPFIYNMVSTATYSYLPAYKQFGEGAKIVHFIGSNKPWLQYFDSETRLVRPPQGSEHLQNLLQLWWDIFCSTVHPSLSPDMAHCSSNETRTDTAPQIVSHFIIDQFQRFQPMSVYSEYQPISITPYIEDPGLGFWDPWENYKEQSNTKYKNHSSHIPLWNYHGSEQQHRAFENDKRQSGWQRHKYQNLDNEQNVVSSGETFQTHSHHSTQSADNNDSFHDPQHHSQQNHQQSQPHQSYQHSHHEAHHHNEQLHHQEFHNHPEIQHHYEPHKEPIHHHQLHYHHEPHNQSEPHHQPHYQHEPYKQPELHHHEPQHYHEHHDHTQTEHHGRLEPHHQEQHHWYNQESPAHDEHQHLDHQHHNEYHQHHSHQHHSEHHQYYDHQHHSEHHHTDHHHTEHHHNDQHHDHHSHNKQQSVHVHSAQHQNQLHYQETYHVYNEPPPPGERQNHKHGHGDHQNHQPQPDPPPPASSVSTTVNNSKYIKVTNEPECLVAQPTLEDKSSKAAENNLGLAGALAKVTLGVPRSAEQAAFEEHMRKQAWEQGSIDYMGRDSFDNIWRKITETLAQAPSKPQAQKPATEIPLTIPVPVPILPEPKSTTLPLTDADDAPGITSSTTDPTAPALQSTQHSEPPLPEPSEPAVPPVSFKGPVLPPSSGEQAVNVGQSIPHTPLITEATPPTSPPIGVPAADSKALTVDVQPLETPPVESTTSKMLSETQIPAPTTQVTQTSEFPVQTEAKLIEQESIQLISKELAAVAEIEATEQKEALSSSQQLIPTHEIPTAPVTVETKLSDAPSPSQQIPTEQESPVAAPTLQILPTQESPSTPVAPPIPQILPAQESTSTPVASSTPIQTSTQEFPVAAPALQILPTQESPSTPVAPSTPIQEVPVAAPTPQILLAQESTSTPVATSTPIQTSTQEVPVSTPAPQILPTQESPSTPVAPSTPIQEVPIAAPTPQILSTQESPSTLVAPSTPIQTSTQESPSTPVVLSTTIPAPTHEVPAAPIVYQELPPTPPASPGTVETKPVETPPSTLTPVLPGKTEAKPVKQKKSPPAPVEHTKSPSAPPTQEGVQQGVATAVQPPIPLQEVPISMTTDKTKPTIAETVPVAEKQGPQPSLTTEQKVDPPILLSSAPSSDSKELPKIPTVAKAASEDPTPTVRSKKELSSVQDVPKRAAETRSSVGQKDTPVPSPQSKPEEPSKSVPTKPSAPVSPPSSPDASPSDQAPIPPKRRGHKGPGTSATDQGAAGKPASQSQPSKASKQGQKGKK
ncbi:nascent polypeptide-associated complex subunit alpha, muscle-specific form-like isoform X2 [Zootermopsis nevadensis]|uniref:nascent polypeptide-associated complex subunit alpha, muscle-specific form-like isoform X2 n=1 Tax=Zootermopsis nevadensis TaxID=136037 RepID=UPI000B8E4F31|nr:nascent polypeptide-associated complex subunit alpha, muscle-specific form-like isoform X2 [Zootermopsis nevadensis]